jgi:hypothetical protein
MTALPVLCMAMMQNFSISDQASLGAELVKTQQDGDLIPAAKMRATVVHLSKYLGPDLVRCVLGNARPIFQEVSVAAATLPAHDDIDAVMRQAKQELS